MGLYFPEKLHARGKDCSVRLHHGEIMEQLYLSTEANIEISLREELEEACN
jgi:hypothetical protein